MSGQCSVVLNTRYCNYIAAAVGSDSVQTPGYCGWSEDYSNTFLRRSSSEECYCYTDAALVVVVVVAAALDDDIAAVDYIRLVVAAEASEQEADNYYSFLSDAVVHSVAVVVGFAAEVRTDCSCSNWNGPLVGDRHCPVDGPQDCRADY